MSQAAEHEPDRAQEILAAQEAMGVAYERLNIVKRYQSLVLEQMDRDETARSLGVTYGRVMRWARLYRANGLAGLVDHRERCGRRPEYLPSEAELACVKELYLRLNTSKVRGRGLGSSRVMAYRLAARGTDGRISDEFRQVVMGRHSKRVPESWMRLLDEPAAVLAAVRDRDSVMLSHISTPRGMTYINRDGVELPVRAGTIFESDDGTVNFGCWVPWPFGGDKCSDKFGVRVGRFQLLPVVDTRTLFCPMFHFVVRGKSSYRGEDVVALFGDAFALHVPEVVRIERGTWESQVVEDALGMTGVHVQHTWEPGQKAGVEGFFNRLWTPLSLVPGDVGRTRGENSEGTDLILACQEGRRDPRDHFMSLEEAVRRITAAIDFVNTEPVESPKWGRWVPREMWDAQLPERRPMPEEMGVYFSREQRVWKVRKGTLGGSVAGPLVRFPIYFQTTELWEYEGCRVKCFFDPYADPVLGTLVLQEEWRGHRAGTVIARDVAALELPPQVVLAEDGYTSETAQRQLAVRKAMAKAVRTEVVSYLGTRRSEARDGLGNVAVRTTDDGGQKTEGRGQKTEGGSQKTEDRGRRTTEEKLRRNPYAALSEDEFNRRGDRFAALVEAGGYEHNRDTEPV